MEIGAEISISSLIITISSTAASGAEEASQNSFSHQLKSLLCAPPIVTRQWEPQGSRSLMRSISPLTNSTYRGSLPGAYKNMFGENPGGLSH